MVAFFTPPPFMKSKTPFAASVESTATITTSGTTQTILGVPIGAPDSSRLVVIAFGYQLAGSITSATIGGIAATIVANSVGTNACCAIIAALVPAGTTADVVINSSAAITSGLCYVAYRIVGSTGSAYSAQSPAGGASATRTATINTALGGKAIAVGSGSANAITSSIGTMVSDEASSAFEISSISNTPLATGATFSQAATRAVCAASWAPAP